MMTVVSHTEAILLYYLSAKALFLAVRIKLKPNGLAVKVFFSFIVFLAN